MGILYRKYQQGGLVNAANTASTTEDYQLGALLLDKYKSSPKLAYKWNSTTQLGKTTSLVTNIKSVINTGASKQDIADLGKLYRGKSETIGSFMGFK